MSRLIQSLSCIWWIDANSSEQRAKLHHNKSIPADASAVSPTLTPIIPEPLAPTSMSSTSTEELQFFDRVKKFLQNKATMNEFLKLCNLFSQDLIDRNVLVHKVSNFIGSNTDLMNWFKAFVNYEGADEVIDNRPKAPTGRVALSNCRGLGPSYRLLPKRVSSIQFCFRSIVVDQITYCASTSR